MDSPPKMFFEFGLRLNSESKLEFFGIDNVNAAVIAGYKVISIEKGRALMTKGIEKDDRVQMSFSGFSVVAVLQLDQREISS
jgi:hypothetical protein